MDDITLNEYYEIFQPVLNLSLNKSNNENTLAERMNNNINNSNDRQNSSFTGFNRSEPNSNPH